jgi:hypothetical protein
VQCYGGGKHPHWEIGGIDIKEAPWAGLLDARTERFQLSGL